MENDGFSYLPEILEIIAVKGFFFFFFFLFFFSFFFFFFMKANFSLANIES